MGRLMALLAERDWPDGAVADAVLGWKGDPGSGADNPALRLAGGLHRLVLDRSDPALAAIYPPRDASDAALWRAVSDALMRHESHLLDALTRAPQTNEVRRAAALAPALAMIAAATRTPLALREVGCAAGLNLRADLFRVTANGQAYGPEGAAVQLAPDWEGDTPPPYPPEIVERRGVDLAPLDPHNAEDRARLLSYLWPDQPERRTWTEAALDLASRVPARVDRGDALDWLADQLPRRTQGIATVVFHTIAWQYLPGAARARGADLLSRAGAAATADTPLAHLSMEADGGDLAALTLTLWPGGHVHTLARVDFHGRRIVWTGPVAL